MKNNEPVVDTTHLKGVYNCCPRHYYHCYVVDTTHLKGVYNSVTGLRPERALLTLLI